MNLKILIQLGMIHLQPSIPWFWISRPLAFFFRSWTRLDLRGLMDWTLNTPLAPKNLRWFSARAEQQKKTWTQKMMAKSYRLRGDGDFFWNDDVALSKRWLGLQGEPANCDRNMSSRKAPRKSEEKGLSQRLASEHMWVSPFCQEGNRL